MLNPAIKEKILTIVESNQPVTAQKVTDLLITEYGIEISLEEVNSYLFRMRTDFPKRIARSADRYNVVDLAED